QPRPGVPRGGVYVPVEDGNWLLTLYGVRGHQPSTDAEEFMAFTTTLADGYLHELASDAEPVSAVHGFRDTANRRRHYEEPGADRRHAEGASMPQGFGERAKSWYFRRLVARATMDPVVGAAYRDLLSMTASPTRVLELPVALRTIATRARPGHDRPPMEIEEI